MKFITTQKFIRTSPRKLRLVREMIKDLTPLKAIEVLPFAGKRAAEPLKKAIQTALANAKQKGINPDDLVFEEIQIGQGPIYKRGQPVARGRWHPIQKKTSHIRVVLRTKEEKKEEKKEKEERKTEKKKEIKKKNKK